MSPARCPLVALLFALSAVVFGCEKRAAESRAATEAPSPFVPASAPDQPAADSAPLPAPSQSPPAASAPAPIEPVPALVDADGEALPQTEDRPSTSGESFRKRLELLVRAIAQDEPEVARPAFFPLLAYSRVKAVANPERDYEGRLLKAFDRDIHEYHRSLGPDAGSARFSAIEVPEAGQKWMKPGSEGNRLGYYRVLRSRLEVALEGGATRSLEITSLISWRGEWYVVHLHGFK